MKYITLDQLTDHPANVRARSGFDDRIESLKASILTLGLLQGLVVQQLEDGAYGVLAGRRRVEALRRLVGEGAMEGDVRIPVKIVPKGETATTAISLAENITQERMSPIDEFEAFAAMIGQGGSPEEIASAFNTTVRAVKERLSFGRIHPEIRAAARRGEISLDVMKAYASHPLPETQKRVYDGFAETPYEHQTWRVRKALQDQDVLADSEFGRLVLDGYRAKGGATVEGLFEEDTVLTDRALAEEVRDELLREAAEAARAKLGFAWAEIRPAYDYSEMSAYGRIYPRPVEVSEEDDARLTGIGERLDALTAEWEALEETDLTEEDAGIAERIEREINDLEAEAHELQYAYGADDLARSGVIAALDHDGRIRVEPGFVRPADRAEGKAQPGEGDGTAGSADGDQPETAVKYSQALLDDLAVEKAGLVAAAIAEDHALAYEALVFKAAQAAFMRVESHGGLDISLREASRAHSRPEALDPEIAERLAAAREGLDLSFLDDSLPGGEQFRRFRVLDADAKAAILASAVAVTVLPLKVARAGGRDTFADALAGEAAPRVRDCWRPTAGNYFSRISKAGVLAHLRELGLEAEADEQAPMKKASVAAYMDQLFAEPFATLTAEQRAAVESWAPAPMRTGEGDVSLRAVA